MRASSSDGGMQHSGALINLGVKHLNEVSASDHKLFFFCFLSKPCQAEQKNQAADIFEQKDVFRHVGSSSRWAGGSLARIERGLFFVTLSD